MSKTLLGTARRPACESCGRRVGVAHPVAATVIAALTSAGIIFVALWTESLAWGLTLFVVLTVIEMAIWYRVPLAPRD